MLSHQKVKVYGKGLAVVATLAVKFDHREMSKLQSASKPPALHTLREALRLWLATARSVWSASSLLALSPCGLIAHPALASAKRNWMRSYQHQERTS